jgi:hypothetical protein
MEVPAPKNSLESAYRLLADIAELFLIHNVPLHQYDAKYPFKNPTPSKAESSFSAAMLRTPSGSEYEEDPSNAVVVPQDLLDRLCDAISDLSEIEESYWNQ